MTTYALPRRRGLLARLIGEADDFTSWLLFGAETWLIASLTFPLITSRSLRARRSPMPTQLNGRTIV